MYPKAQWTDSWLVLSSQLDVIFSQSGIPVRLQLHVAQSGFPITLQLDAIFTHSGVTVRLPFDQTFTWSGILVRLQLNVTQSGLPVTLQLGTGSGFAVKLQLIHLSFGQVSQEDGKCWCDCIPSLHPVLALSLIHI